MNNKIIVDAVGTYLFESFTIFRIGEIMVSKYGHLLLPGTFSDKVTPENGFIDKAVVPCHVAVVKIFL